MDIFWTMHNVSDYESDDSESIELEDSFSDSDSLPLPSGIVSRLAPDSDSLLLSELIGSSRLPN